MTASDTALLRRLARRLGRGDGTSRPATQAQVAAALGRSVAHVNMVLSGKRSLSPTLRLRASEVLDGLGARR